MLLLLLCFCAYIVNQIELDKISVQHVKIRKGGQQGKIVFLNITLTIIKQTCLFYMDCTCHSC